MVECARHFYNSKSSNNTGLHAGDVGGVEKRCKQKRLLVEKAFLFAAMKVRLAVLPAQGRVLGQGRAHPPDHGGWFHTLRG